MLRNLKRISKAAEMGSESNFECCFDEETNIEDAIMGNGCPFVVNYIGCIEIVRKASLPSDFKFSTKLSF